MFSILPFIILPCIPETVSDHPTSAVGVRRVGPGLQQIPGAGEFGQTMWVFKEFHRVVFAGIVFSLMVFVC